jgi:hypothetical protein
MGAMRGSVHPSRKQEVSVTSSFEEMKIKDPTNLIILVNITIVISKASITITTIK